MKKKYFWALGMTMMAAFITLTSCAPQLDSTPPPVDPYDVRYGARTMYVTSSFRVYAPLMDRIRVEQIAMNEYGVRDVSWSPHSYIMTVQYYPGRTNTSIIQMALARAGYDTSDYRAVSMRPIVLPPTRVITTPRQPVVVPRNPQPPRNNQPNQGGRVGVNNPNTHSGQPAQPQSQGGTVKPQGNQPAQQQNTQQNQQSQPTKTTTSGGHFGGKRN